MKPAWKWWKWSLIYGTDPWLCLHQLYRDKQARFLIIKSEEWIIKSISLHSFINMSYKFFLWCTDLPPLLHTELTCEGEAVRDYLYRQMAHKICTSTSRVQRLECRHSCSSGLCCAPTKSRRRKLSFKCPDGSSFSEEMEITVECGCTKCSS